MDSERFDPVEEAIDDFMEGRPRARELDELIAALEIRRDTFASERGTETDQARRKLWDARIRETEEQIKALREERAITGFVEDSVRFSVQRSRRPDDLSELDEFDDYSGRN